MSTQSDAVELLEALNGGKGMLDGWLEVHDESEVRAAIFELAKGSAGAETLRDKFAAKAMQGFIASGDYQHPMLGSSNGRNLDQWIAQSAYDYADAMLSAREAQS